MTAQDDEDDEDGPVNHWQPDREQPLLLREFSGDVPEAARALLATGGTPAGSLHQLLEDGRIFVLGDVADAGEGPYVAAAIVLTTGGPTAQLAALAADPSHPEAAERLLRGVAERLCGYGILRVSTSVPPLSPEHRPALASAGFHPADAATTPGASGFERAV